MYTPFVNICKLQDFKLQMYLNKIQTYTYVFKITSYTYKVHLSQSGTKIYTSLIHFTHGTYL